MKDIDDKLHSLHKQIADQPELDLGEKESIFSQIDKPEGDRNKELEKALLKVLPRGINIGCLTASTNPFCLLPSSPETDGVRGAVFLLHAGLRDIVQGARRMLPAPETTARPAIALPPRLPL